MSRKRKIGYSSPKPDFKCIDIHFFYIFHTKYVLQSVLILEF